MISDLKHFIVWVCNLKCERLQAEWQACLSLRLHQVSVIAGVYDYETTAVLRSGTTMMLDYEDLLPGMQLTEAISIQFFANGAECEVTDFDEEFHNEDETSMLRLDRPSMQHACLWLNCCVLFIKSIHRQALLINDGAHATS